MIFLFHKGNGWTHQRLVALYRFSLSLLIVSHTITFPYNLYWSIYLSYPTLNDPWFLLFWYNPFHHLIFSTPYMLWVSHFSVNWTYILINLRFWTSPSRFITIFVTINHVRIFSVYFLGLITIYGWFGLNKTLMSY